VKAQDKSIYDTVMVRLEIKMKNGRLSSSVDSWAVARDVTFRAASVACALLGLRAIAADMALHARNQLNGLRENSI